MGVHAENTKDIIESESEWMSGGPYLLKHIIFWVYRGKGYKKYMNKVLLRVFFQT